MRGRLAHQFDLPKPAQVAVKERSSRPAGTVLGTRFFGGAGGSPFGWDSSRAPGDTFTASCCTPGRRAQPGYARAPSLSSGTSETLPVVRARDSHARTARCEASMGRQAARSAASAAVGPRPLRRTGLADRTAVGHLAAVYWERIRNVCRSLIPRHLGCGVAYYPRGLLRLPTNSSKSSACTKACCAKFCFDAMLTTRSGPFWRGTDTAVPSASGKAKSPFPSGPYATVSARGRPGV